MNNRVNEMELDHQVNEMELDQVNEMDLDPEPNMLPNLEYLALDQHIPINENLAQEIGLGYGDDVHVLEP